MDASTPPPDAERELDELRRRAYGPHPDIQDDPAALARLTELEAAHTPQPPVQPEHGRPAAPADPDLEEGIPGEDLGEDPPRSLWSRLTSTRARRSAVLAGALLGLVGFGSAAVWLGSPHPDATLQQVTDEPGEAVLWRLDFLEAAVDLSSARGYEAYRGVEPWFVVDEQGFECFMVLQPLRGTVDGANCVPPGVDLFADISDWALLGKDRKGLPDGSIIRFHYRDGSVDAYDYRGAGALD